MKLYCENFFDCKEEFISKLVACHNKGDFFFSCEIRCYGKVRKLSITEFQIKVYEKVNNVNLPK